MTETVENAGKTSKITYATVTSTIALVVSLVSFYFTWFHESHSLKLGVVSTGTDDLTLPLTFEADLILLNRGNKTETLLAVNLSFDSPDSPERIERVYNPSLQKGPYVLKSNDAVPVHLEWKIGEDEFGSVAKWSGPTLERNAEGEVSLRVSAISPKGAEIMKRILLGKLNYYEPSGEVKFSRDGSKQINLLELLE